MRLIVKWPLSGKASSPYHVNQTHLHIFKKNILVQNAFADTNNNKALVALFTDFSTTHTRRNEGLYDGLLWSAVQNRK